MKENHDAAVAVAQILISNLLRTSRDKLSDEIIRAQAKAANAVLGGNIDEDKLTSDLIAIYNVTAIEASMLVDDRIRTQWLPGVDRATWRFWPRYRTQLLHSMPEKVVNQVDVDTDRIIEQLESPEHKGVWDRRGLVVGEVQSGKTTNYTALVCKAADVGYKVIIVLAGIHESLRVQTQMRLEEGFLGRNSLSAKLIGVGLIDPKPFPATMTTRKPKGDFKKQLAENLAMSLDGHEPLLLVIKKNRALLKNVLNFLANSSNGAARQLPLLIVDDEADNASINTSHQNVDNVRGADLSAQPTAINSSIRQILKTFDRKAYVGYTATPFANIFIHHQAETDADALDLFPRDFIVNLHAPSNYFGVAEAFGLSDDIEGSGQPLLRSIDASIEDQGELHAWLPPGHTAAYRPKLNSGRSIPKSLWRAILSFVLATAIRKLRGQVTAHNSMLIHVTRFTALQDQVFEAVSEQVEAIGRALRYADRQKDENWTELRRLFDTDFQPTTDLLASSNLPGTGHLRDWETVADTLFQSASGIKIKKINGVAEDILDYELHKHEGIDVIAIGGDKLSRGLTLEGLTVSYFTRPSNTFDTLLQMGRWFGYRPGYLDLCRLYTTDTLRSAFENIARAGDELREDFDQMAGLHMTPIEFGLKVRSYPRLKPTASNKRRHAEDVILYKTYAGKVSEAKSFSLDTAILQSNMTALSELVADLRKRSSPNSPAYGSRSYAEDYLWKGVSAEPVLTFLDQYGTEASARRANSGLWARYIQTQIDKAGELQHWNVALFNGSLGEEIDVGGLTVQRRLRAPDSFVDQTGGYRIRRLVTNRDVGIDLDEPAWNLARRFKQQNAPEAKVPVEPTSQANCWARKQLQLPPLLMLYLPSPEQQLSDTPVLGVAIAFPGSDRAIPQLVSYTVNSVYLQDPDFEWEESE